jgi:DNA polymerase III psi subunit
LYPKDRIILNYILILAAIVTANGIYILFYTLSPNNISYMAFSTFELLTLKQSPDHHYITPKSNQNNVMIVLSANEDEKLRSTLLPKIMNAVHIDIEKEAILVEAPNYGINIVKLISEQNAIKVISFGVSPSALSINLSALLYKINKIGDVEFLFSDNLKVISTNQERKKALWNQLQSLFPKQ